MRMAETASNGLFGALGSRRHHHTLRRKSAAGGFETFMSASVACFVMRRKAMSSARKARQRRALPGSRKHGEITHEIL